MPVPYVEGEAVPQAARATITVTPADWVVICMGSFSSSKWPRESPAIFGCRFGIHRLAIPTERGHPRRRASASARPARTPR